MTIEDIREYTENAVTILKKNDQYATAKAVEEAFSALINFKELFEKDMTQDAVYKDGTFVCPACGASTYPLALYGGEYCQQCGQHINWKGLIK